MEQNSEVELPLEDIENLMKMSGMYFHVVAHSRDNLVGLFKGPGDIVGTATSDISREQAKLSCWRNYVKKIESNR